MFARNWHSFDVGTNQPVRQSCCQSFEDLPKVIQVEIFIEAYLFSPKNKTRDLRLKILFTISYILSKAGMHLKRKFSISIVMFTGNVIFFILRSIVLLFVHDRTCL